MRVTVRLFATLRQQAGWSSKQVDLVPNATLQSLLHTLDEQEPELSMADRSVYAAVNQRYTTLETELQDGDEVAFFPPVSGG